MSRQEIVINDREAIGVLHIAEWGVTFDPTEPRPAFNLAKLKTWETVESAKVEILRTVHQAESAI